MKLKMLIGLGCFWSVEAAFGYPDGVLSCRSIYASGSALEATYDHLNGHAEGVLVEYESNIIPTIDLIKIYMSYLGVSKISDEQRYKPFFWAEGVDIEMLKSMVDTALMDNPAASGRMNDINFLSHVIDGDNIVFPIYMEAEVHHQKVYLRRQQELYAYVLTLSSSEREALCTYEATKINAYLAGNGTMKELSTLKESLVLPEPLWNRLYLICLRYMND